VRFLGRKVYADLIVVLISAIRLKLDLNLPHATLPSIPIEFPENLMIKRIIVFKEGILVCCPLKA